ncbi:hypothetical protein DPMN_045085 [Dreissena polymorpha]|uniref:Uncharacterized protein n=1 Tax=Dreissena polymorpha TaxID=45954 RepID=A0A9D4D3G2_DREPO|nr:hypothetical protein DPMN_045085 [Dreissena polymorpha]
MVPDSLTDQRGTCKRLPCILRRRLFCNLLQVSRRSLHRRRLSVSLVQVPRRSGRLSDTIWESPACAWTVLAPSQTVWESIVGAQTFFAILHTVWESPAAAQAILAPSQTVLESLQVLQRSGRLAGSLRLVPRQSWHRRRLSGCPLQVPRRSGRISCTVWESPAGALTVLALSQTVWESPSCAPTV